MGTGLAIAGITLAAGSGILGAKQTIEAGKIQAGEAEVAAEQEELGAVQREADRKARLASALASQNAASGAKGIAAFEGSPLSIMEADIEAEKEGTKRDIFQSELAAKSLRARGRMSKRMAEAQASLGLLGTAGSLGTQVGLATMGGGTSSGDGSGPTPGTGMGGR